VEAKAKYVCRHATPTLPLLTGQAYTEDKVPSNEGVEDAVGSLCCIINSLPSSEAGVADTKNNYTAGAARAAGGYSAAEPADEPKPSSGTSRSNAVVKEMSRFVAAAVKWAQK